jgi:hypothetical protein
LTESAIVSESISFFESALTLTVTVPGDFLGSVTETLSLVSTVRPFTFSVFLPTVLYSFSFVFFGPVEAESETEPDRTGLISGVVGCVGVVAIVAALAFVCGRRLEAGEESMSSDSFEKKQHNPLMQSQTNPLTTATGTGLTIDLRKEEVEEADIDWLTN